MGIVKDIVDSFTKQLEILKLEKKRLAMEVERERVNFENRKKLPPPVPNRKP